MLSKNLFKNVRKLNFIVPICVQYNLTSSRKKSEFTQKIDFYCKTQASITLIFSKKMWNSVQKSLS